MIDHLAATVFELAANFLADGRGDASKDSILPSISDMNARTPGCWMQV